MLDEEQSRIWRPENSGLAEAAMPLYSTQKSVTITNYYLPRDLSVSKSVLYNEANQDTADCDDCFFCFHELFLSL